MGNGLVWVRLSRPESRFIERAPVRSRLSPVQAATSAARRAVARERETVADRIELPEHVQRLVPYLARRIGVPFRGRILEIGAATAWFSAELSKLPGVVEIIATDISAKRLKEEAPRVFRKLGAIESKIIRMPGDAHKLGFRDNHFDFVVCSAVLNRTANIVAVLREARRVLKPGGWFVAVREPVRPLWKAKSGKAAVSRTRDGRLLYSLDEYERFFAAAGLTVEFKRVNLDSGMKHFFNRMFNGLTHARYALIGRKATRSGASQPKARTKSQAASR